AARGTVREEAPGAGARAVQTRFAVAARDPALAALGGVAAQVGVAGAGLLIAILEARLAPTFATFALQVEPGCCTARLIVGAFLLVLAAAARADRGAAAHGRDHAARQSPDGDAPGRRDESSGPPVEAVGVHDDLL